MSATAPGSPAAEGASAGSASLGGALPAELVERFASTLQRLNPGAGRLGLAVSGGPDSMAMLLLAHAAVRGGFEVATVDHGLRAEAAGECALVEAACEARGIACAVLQVEVAGGNLQAEARAARYAALRAWAGQRGLSAIATAHHADDQAETLLMRLNRGCGTAGLAGVRERARLEGAGELRVLRPLLGFRRAELGKVVTAAEVAIAQDRSNEDERFERVRIRKALAESDWLDPLAVAASARHLAEADEALDWAAERERAERVTVAGEGYTFDPVAPPAIRLRIAEAIIRAMGGAPRGGEVARLLGRLERGESGNLAGVLVQPESGRWVFRPEPARRS